MIVLGLDTTGGCCTASSVDGDQTLAEMSENIGRGHAERLAPMVQELLIATGLVATNIERVGVCTGPGSFTGLRVALAFAKGFTLPRKLPVIGIPALEVLAAQSLEQRVLSVMDVRRGEVCWALYENGITIQAPVTQKVELARETISEHQFDTSVGDGAHFITEPATHVVVSGACLARLAQTLPPDRYRPIPLYSRAPDAKLPGGITPP